MSNEPVKSVEFVEFPTTNHGVENAVWEVWLSLSQALGVLAFAPTHHSGGGIRVRAYSKEMTVWHIYRPQLLTTELAISLRTRSSRGGITDTLFLVHDTGGKVGKSDFVDCSPDRSDRALRDILADPKVEHLDQIVWIVAVRISIQNAAAGRGPTLGVQVYNVPKGMLEKLRDEQSTSYLEQIAALKDPTIRRPD